MRGAVSGVPVRDGQHPCPGLCGLRVKNNTFACPGCTARLPVELRAGTQSAYTLNRRAAIEDAIAWFREHR